jgi:hypothetical protein
MQTAMAAFDDALTLFAPNQARDVAQMLSDIRAGRSLGAHVSLAPNSGVRADIPGPPLWASSRTP